MSGIVYRVGMNTAPALGGLKVLMAKLAALAGVGAMMAGVKKALDLGGRFDDLSARIGVSAGEAQLLDQAFKEAGMGAGQVGQAVQIMQRSLAGVNAEGGNTAKTFSRLGLDMAALRNLSPTAQIQTIGQAIRGLENPAARSAAAMELFGRSGGEMVTLFNNPDALTNAAKSLGGQADILNRMAGTFDRASDLLGNAGLKTQGFFLGVADQVAPLLLPLLEGFNSIDLTGMGQKLGEMIAFLITAFSSGEMGTIVGESMRVGLMDAVNALWAALQGVGEALPALFAEAGRALVSILRVVVTKDFWTGVANALAGAALGFTSLLLRAVSRVNGLIAGLLRTLGADTLADVAQMQSDMAGRAADSAGAQGRAMRDEGRDLLEPAMLAVRDGAAAAMEAAQQAFAEGSANAAQAFDTAPAMAALEGAITRVQAAMDKAREGLDQVAEASVSAAATEDAAATAPGRRESFADRLRQIGGMVGNNAAAIRDRAAERTMNFTERTAKAVEKMARNPTPAGVF